MPEISKPSGPIDLIRERYGDIDELSEAVRGWGLDFRQLDRGPLRADLCQARSQVCLITYFRLDRRFYQRGVSPPGVRTFGLLEEGSRIRWCGWDVDDSCLLSFPSTFEAVSPPGFEGHTLSVTEEQLVRVAAELDPDVCELLESRSAACLRVKSGPMARLRALLRRACKRAVGSSATVNYAELESEVPSQLVRALSSAHGVAACRPVAWLRERALRRAREYVDASADRVVQMGDLCRAAGASERTLQYAFRDHFGVTPQAYVKAARLQRVRRELRREDPGTVKIADVANRLDFWHLGQLAADYRRLFGELPSQTLNRRTSARIAASLRSTASGSTSAP